MNDAVVMWANIWKWIIIVGSGGFFLLMIYTIITGARDVRNLFVHLRKQGESESQSQD